MRDTLSLKRRVPSWCLPACQPNASKGCARFRCQAKHKTRFHLPPCS